jgi:hypothetical protein
MIDRLNSSAESKVRIIAPKDEAERRAFWIARGNDHLASLGKSYLQWACVNGSYFIEPRR